MVATTVGDHIPTDTWVDITTVLAGITSVPLNITGKSAYPTEIFFGGAGAPTGNGDFVGFQDVLAGVDSANIWVRAASPLALIHVVTI